MTRKMIYTKYCVNCGANTNSTEKCINCGLEIATKSLSEDDKTSLALATIERSDIDSEAQKKRVTDAGKRFAWPFRVAAILELIALRNSKEHFVGDSTTALWSALFLLLLLSLIAPRAVISQRNTRWSHVILGTLIIAKIFVIYAVVVHFDRAQVVFTSWQFLLAQILWIFSILCVLSIFYESNIGRTGFK